MPWGCASGKKGSYNYTHIQFEICEDALKDEKYFNDAFGVAIEFCAYLCDKYNLSADSIVSHHEAHLKGYASNHGDCDHWLKKFNKNMNWFRNEVKAKLEKKDVKPEPPKPSTDNFLGARGYIKLGDRGSNVEKIANFMYKTFPAYTSKAALGNYYGPNIQKSIKEFQTRTGLESDGCVGPLTLAMLKKYGFNY